MLPAIAIAVAAFVFWPDPPLPIFDPASLDFGEQRTETSGQAQQVTLRNGGERQLDILGLEEGQGDFHVVDETCSGVAIAPGAECTYSIVFAPSAAGPRSGELSLIANVEARLPLTGLGTAPALRFGSETVDFGDRPVGGRSTGAAVAMVNAGSAPLALGRVTIEGEDQDDFSLVGRCKKKVIEIGEGCDFRVAFAPRASGERKAYLQVTSDASEEPEMLPLVGFGKWEGPEIESDPSRLSFSVLKVGRRSGEKEVVLTNRSEESVMLSKVEVEDPASGFEVVGDTCVASDLPPGESCEVRVAFAPRSAGPVSTILLAARDAGGGASVPLSGEAALPELRLDPAAIDFGRVRTGTESEPIVLAVRSVGRVPLVVDAIGLAGTAASGPFEIEEDDCTRATIPPGSSCEMSLIFRPGVEGDLRADLSVRSDTEGRIETIGLVGRGVTSKLSLEPGRIDFGEVIRTQSATREVLIANRGEASLAIEGLELQGGAAGDYRIDDIGCILDSGLAPGATCPLKVRFTPKQNGRREASIEVRQAEGGKTASIALRGQGLEPEPRLRVVPSRAEFGSVNIGERSSVVTVTLRNEGEGSLTLRGFRIGGDDAADFVIIPSTCNGIPRIAPHGECSIGLRFVPAEAGRRLGILQIDHDDANHHGRVDLDGTAIGAPAVEAPSVEAPIDP